MWFYWQDSQGRQPDTLVGMEDLGPCSVYMAALWEVMADSSGTACLTQRLQVNYFPQKVIGNLCIHVV